MTKSEKIICAIHCIKVQDGNEVCQKCRAFNMGDAICEDISSEAIKALEDIQEYRKLGTIEELKNQKHNLSVAYRIISDYQDLGTVEEIREVVEKSRQKTGKQS